MRDSEDVHLPPDFNEPSRKTRGDHLIDVAIVITAVLLLSGIVLFLVYGSGREST
jgi:hypothetical protein